MHLLPLGVYGITGAQAMMMSAGTLVISTGALVGTTLTNMPLLVTLPIALQQLTSMIVTLPASLLMGRYGRKVVFTSAAVIAIIGAAICVQALMAQSFWLFCVGIACIGVLNGAGSYLRFAATELVPPTLAARAVSTVMLGGIIAAIIGPWLAAYGYLSANIPFVGSYLLMGVVCVIGLLCILSVRFTSLTTTGPSSDNNTANRPLPLVIWQLRCVTAMACVSGGFAVMAFIMIATPLAMQSAGFVFDDIAAVMRWHALSMFVPSFFTGYLITRFGVRPILTTGILCLVLTVACNWFVDSYWLFVTALVALGVGWNFLFVGGTTLLTTCYQPSERTQVQGVNDFVMFSMITLASLLSGYVFATVGWQWLNIVTLPISITLFILIMLFDRQHGPTLSTAAGAGKTAPVESAVHQ